MTTMHTAQDTHRKLSDGIAILRAGSLDLRDRDPVAFEAITRALRELETARYCAETWILQARLPGSA
jgi:hypothetical protein